MTYVRGLLVLAGMFIFVLMAAPAAAQCNCTNSSLVGDSVTTQAGNGPILTATVNASSTEHIGAGPGLGMAGPSPRMNIDYTANTIRVDFVQQPATYGANYVFKFANLNPIPPQGCAGPAKIVGITVHTNKANAPFVVSGATFGPNHVHVPFAGSTNVDWLPGEFFLVRLQFACDPPPATSGFDPCCPPWNSTQLKSMLFYQGTNIGGNYTLKFMPTPQLHTQMNAYITYLQSLGMGFSTISLNFELIPGGTGATWSGSTPSQTATVTWTGSGSPTPNFFSAGAMIPNTWYRIRTTVLLPPNPHFLPEKCRMSYVDVRLQLFPSPFKGRGVPRPARLQFKPEGGRLVEEAVQLVDTPRD